MSIQYDVKNLGLADAGRDAIEWADRQMPVLSLIRERFGREQPQKVYSVPLGIDQKIARLKLVSMGVTLDKLTAKQEKHLASWEEGT